MRDVHRLIFNNRYNNKTHFWACEKEARDGRCPFEAFRRCDHCRNFFFFLFFFPCYLFVDPGASFRIVEPGILLDIEGECAADGVSVGLVVLFILVRHPCMNIQRQFAGTTAHTSSTYRCLHIGTLLTPLAARIGRDHQRNDVAENLVPVPAGCISSTAENEEACERLTTVNTMCS